LDEEIIIDYYGLSKPSGNTEWFRTRARCANIMLSFLKSAIKNSLIYGLGNVSTKIIGFILLPIYTSNLSVQQYGILGLLEVSSQILISVFGLSLTYPFFRWYWDKEFIEKRHSIMFSCMTCLLFVVLILIGAVILFADQISLILFDSSQYSLLVIMLSVSASLQILASIPSSLLQLQQKATLFTTVNIAQLTTSLIITIICVAYLKLNVLGIYIGQTIGFILYFALLSNYILKNITPVFSWTILKGMLAVSLPLVFSSIAGVVINIADRYFLRYMGNLTEVGIYSLGYRIANTLYVIVVMSINLAIVPMLYKLMDDPRSKRVCSKTMTYVAFGVMFCVIGISFLGREIIRVVALNPEYWNSYKIIPFVSFAIYFGMLKDISSIGLNLTKKTKIISGIVITISLVNILSNTLLIPILQTIGASISALISQLFFFLLIVIYAQKYYFVPYEWGKIILITILGVAIVSIGSLVQDAHLAIRLITKFLLLTIFPVLLYYFNFFEPVELKRLQQVWMKWNNPLNWKSNITELLNSSV
jgi:O-antigen/teichoic acid export membrane protein